MESHDTHLAHTAAVSDAELKPLPDRDDIHVDTTPHAGLVYGDVRPGVRDLIGFVDVEDWAGVREELRARGLGTGAVHHLPVFDHQR